MLEADTCRQCRCYVRWHQRIISVGYNAATGSWYMCLNCPCNVQAELM